VRVVIGVARIADKDAAAEFVEAVQNEYGGCFATQRVPGRQPP
jgi:hypothetical protein